MVESPQTRRKKRVAIIGSGLAGLSAAHLLALEKKEQHESSNNDDIEVHIFEKAQRIGMDSASIDVAGADGKVHRVDSPMRAVQGGYYTRLLNLYRNIGVQLEKSNFTYSFFELSSRKRRDRHVSSSRALDDTSDNRPSRESAHCNGHTNGFNDKEKRQDSKGQSETHKKTTFIYNGGNGLSLRPIGLPSSQADIDYYSLSITNLLNILYYIYEITQILFKASFFALCYIYLALLSFYHVFLSHTSSTSTHPLSKSTLSTFLKSTFLPRSFVIEIIIPLFSCVATCSPAEVMAYPAGEILEYIAKSFGSDHYVVQGGVRNVVRALLRDVPEENIHLGCELISLRRAYRSSSHVVEEEERGAEDEEETQGKLELKEASGQTWQFDEVIFATQANQARFLLSDYYKSLRDSEAPLDTYELNLEKERLDALGRFSYTTSVVVNHYDEGSTLVGSKDDRRILNLARWNGEDIAFSSSSSSTKIMEETKLDPRKRLPKEYIMATHDLSVLHPNCRSPSSGSALLQTTNPTVQIEEENIVSSQVFERAIMTLESKATLREFMRYPESDDGSAIGSGREIGRKERECFQGLGGIWFVGAWAAEGIPLLEGCVVSAERAVEAIRAR